jgi:hypothetical protein
VRGGSTARLEVGFVFVGRVVALHLRVIRPTAGQQQCGQNQTSTNKVHGAIVGDGRKSARPDGPRLVGGAEQPRLCPWAGQRWRSSRSGPVEQYRRQKDAVQHRDRCADGLRPDRGNTLRRRVIRKRLSAHWSSTAARCGHDRSNGRQVSEAAIMNYCFGRRCENKYRVIQHLWSLNMISLPV